MRSLMMLLALACPALAAPVPFLRPVPFVGRTFHWGGYLLRVTHADGGWIVYESLSGSERWRDRMTVEQWRGVIEAYPQTGSERRR